METLRSRAHRLLDDRERDTVSSALAALISVAVITSRRSAAREPGLREDRGRAVHGRGRL
jgi:hypothetical protein